MTSIILFVMCGISLAVWLGIQADRAKIKKLDRIEEVAEDTNKVVHQLAK